MIPFNVIYLTSDDDLKVEATQRAFKWSLAIIWTFQMVNTGYVIVSRLKNLKRKQRLYYDENFRKLYFTSLSLLLVVTVSFVGNLTNKFFLDNFNFDQFSDNKLSLFIWSIAKTLAVLIYLAGKVYKDEFIELNRDRTEVIVSIF